jgi:hypothetical protein
MAATTTRTTTTSESHTTGKTKNQTIFFRIVGLKNS